MMYKYAIEIFFSEEDEGYISVAPELPGCSAFGETVEKALEEIKIAIELLDGSSSLKAFAHLTFPTPLCEITFSRFKIFENEEKKLWVALPSEVFTKNGKRRFIPLIDIPKHIQKDLGRKILSEYKEKINDLRQS